MINRGSGCDLSKTVGDFYLLVNYEIRTGQVAHGNAKVRQHQNRHKSSPKSDKDSSSNAEESLDGGKNRAGSSKKSKSRKVKVRQNPKKCKSSLSNEVKSNSEQRETTDHAKSHL